MQTLSFSEARSRLKFVLDKAVEDADIAIITRRNAQDAVVMSLDYYNSLIETVYLLQSPANAAHLAESVGQLRDGNIVDGRLVDG